MSRVLTFPRRLYELAVIVAIAIVLTTTALAQPACYSAGEVEAQLDRIAAGLSVQSGERVYVLKLTDPGQVARYKAVIDELPPESGPADELLILVTPSIEVGPVGVWLVYRHEVCQQPNGSYSWAIGHGLHGKALRKARGDEI